MNSMKKHSYESVFCRLFSAWIVITILSISSMLQTPSVLSMCIYARVIITGLIVFVAFLNNLKTNVKFLFAVIISIACVISLYSFWGGVYAESAIIVVCGYQFEFRKTAKYAMITTSITVLCIIIGAYCGLLRNYNFGTVMGGQRGVRYGMGFSYSTYCSHYVLLITLLYIFLMQERISIYHLIIILILNQFVYSQTASRNSYILVILSVIISIFLKRFKGLFKNSILNKIIIGFSYIWLTIIEIVFGYIYNPGNPIMYGINKLMSDRLYLNSLAIKTYKITLLGQQTAFNTLTWKDGVFGFHGLSNVYTGMDSSYLDILYRNGIITLGLVLICFTIAMVKSINNNDRYLTLIFFMIAIHSAVDPQMILLPYNTFMFLALSIALKKPNVLSRKMSSSRYMVGKIL